MAARRVAPLAGNVSLDNSNDVMTRGAASRKEHMVVKNQARELPVAEEIRAKVREFIVANFLFGNDSPDLADQSSFLQSGVIDSTGILELIRFVEITYQIRIGEEETIPENLDSLERLASFVVRKAAQAGQDADG